MLCSGCQLARASAPSLAEAPRLGLDDHGILRSLRRKPHWRTTWLLSKLGDPIGVLGAPPILEPIFDPWPGGLVSLVVSLKTTKYRHLPNNDAPGKNHFCEL